MIESMPIKRMFNNYRNIGADKKTLLSNFFSLSSIDAANYILPLITLPYLVRVLGPEKFGLIAFAQAFIQYFSIITDYGFNFSATKSVSLHRNDKEALSRIFGSVMMVKLILMTVSFFILMGIVFFVPKFKMDWPVYLFTFGLVIGNVIFPVWFFQGMERMKFIAFLNLSAKFIFLIAIFIFIKSPLDYIYVPLINSSGFFLAGVLGLWLSLKKFGIKFGIPDKGEIIRETRDGWYFFVSTVTASAYTIGIPFLLGVLTNYRVVGFYSAGDKIIKAVESMQSRLTQTVYPYISKLASISMDAAITFLGKFLKIAGLSTFVLSLTLALFAPQIVSIVLGDHFTETVSVIRILAFLLFIKGVGHVFLLQIMFNFGHEKMVFMIVLLSAVASLSLSFILIPILTYNGAAVAALIPEIVMLLSSALFVSKKYSIFRLRTARGI